MDNSARDLGAIDVSVHHMMLDFLRLKDKARKLMYCDKLFAHLINRAKKLGYTDEFISQMGHFLLDELERQQDRYKELWEQNKQDAEYISFVFDKL
jgi:hypothetical protein